MLFIDRAAVSGSRRTADGYLAATVAVARTGIQTYSGREVGRPDLGVVRVYRPESEVFSKDALGSFAHRPVTDDHPSEAVGSGNWKKHAVGMTGADVARDGEFVRIQMVVMDQAAIDQVQAGKRELSMGYSCDVDFTPGTTPQGEPYDAVQRRIRGNHLAIVMAGRAGAACRIGDSWSGPAERNGTMQDMKNASIAARDAMIERQSNAWKGDGQPAASLPAAIYDALPIKHRSTLPRAIGTVHDAKASGNAVALRHAVDDLRRTAAGLSPMPGSMTTDAESAIERARQWCLALCDTVSGR